jgi:hypothetical protein
MIGKNDIIGKELRIEDTFKDSVLSCNPAHRKMIGQLVRVVEYHNNKDYVYVETIEGKPNKQIFPKRFIIDQHRNYDKSIEDLIKEMKQLISQI